MAAAIYRRLHVTAMAISPSSLGQSEWRQAMLMILGGVLVVVGLIVLLFMRDRDKGGETKFKLYDVEIGSTKPSMLLVGVGAVLLVVPYVKGANGMPSGPDLPIFQQP